MTTKQQLQNSLTIIDKNVTTMVHSSVSTIHANDGSLTKQTKSLQSRTTEARKHEENWTNLVRAGRNGMKDLGDAGNWAALLDREITFLENVVQQTRQ